MIYTGDPTIALSNDMLLGPSFNEIFALRIILAGPSWLPCTLPKNVMRRLSNTKKNSINTSIAKFNRENGLIWLKENSINTSIAKFVLTYIFIVDESMQHMCP